MIKKKGYADYEKEIFITASNLVFKDYVMDSIKPVLMYFNSVPSAATIIVDSVRIGETNKEVKLLPGEHKIEIKKNGYEPVTKNISVSHSMSNTQEYFYLKKGKGTVLLDIDPPDASVEFGLFRVYKNGSRIELPLGDNSYKVFHDGYSDESGVISVKKNEETVLKVNLRQKTGSARIEVLPEQTHCILKKDGKIVREFVHKCDIEELPVGYYDVFCQCEGYRSKTLYFEVFEGENSWKQYELDRKLFLSKKEDHNIELESYRNMIIDKKKKNDEKEEKNYYNYSENNKDETKFNTDYFRDMQRIDKDKNIESVNLQVDMVFVEGGTFSMGSNTGGNDERPVHSVTVSDFYMGKYEVTQEFYETIMGSNPSYFAGSDNPVESVSWYDAVVFCNKLSERDALQKVYTISETNISADISKNGYRLPTEAEWDYAARGGNTSQEYPYSGSNTIGDVAWYSSYGTHPVGQKQANELGLYDMSGNVWEWCWDWHGSYSSTSETNPEGPSSGSYQRVLRGGSWSDCAYNCRVAFRYSSDPSSNNRDIGFRLTRSAR